MISVSNISRTSIDSATWEPFLEGEEQIGEVDWLCQREDETGALFAGLWRHRPEEHPDGVPYRVAGSETFHVLEGACELTLKNGEAIRLQAGDSVTFADGFEATWRTIEPFLKFFVVAVYPPDDGNPDVASEEADHGAHHH
jgi:uncharacterized cupin superfamily protein